MKISTQAGMIERKYGKDVCFKILANAGFDGIDYLLSEKAIPWNNNLFSDVLTSAFKEYFESVAKQIRAYGLEVFYTHSPYRRPFQCDAEGYAMVLQQTIRAIYATAYMNCPFIVVHPIVHPDFNNGEQKDAALDANIKYFKKLAPALKESGVVACIENLYYGAVNEAKIPNACSDPDQLCALIDTLNADCGNHFAACLDTGHAIVCGQDPAAFVRKLGKRLSALHVHDSLGKYDDHFLPGDGIGNWKDFVNALYEIEYGGVFNFEADGYMEDFARPVYNDKVEVMQDAMKLLCTVGHAMTDR